MFRFFFFLNLKKTLLAQLHCNLPGEQCKPLWRETHIQACPS